MHSSRVQLPGLWKPGILQACNPSTQVRRQEDQKFEASLGYIRL